MTKLTLPIAAERMRSVAGDDHPWSMDAECAYRIADAILAASLSGIGRALLDALDANGEHPALKGWAPMDCPSEIVADLLNILDWQRRALQRLVFAARTTGGTAGADAGLMIACDHAQDVLNWEGCP